MKSQNKYLLLSLFVFLFNIGLTQDLKSDSSYFSKKKWFITSGIGIQMSGIKNEDFISSNISPSLMLNTGLWFSPEIALQFGYKGSYFKTISDNEKHFFSFFYGDVLINLNSTFNFCNSFEGEWRLIVHPGAGWFYNYYYNRPNVCVNLGLMNTYSISNKLDIFVDVSAIMGWDIYQGDEDILPSCVFGLTYSFR